MGTPSVDALLEKYQPREGEKEKEMTVLSEKGKITIKSEIATSLKEPFKECPIEMTEEAFKRKYKVIGTDIEPEHEDLDTAAEEEEVGKVNKEEKEIFGQYKEFYMIQARSKGKMPGFLVYALT